MRLLLFFYLVLTVFVSGRMAVDGLVWGGIALLIGSLLGFAGGSGMRGSFYRGQKRSGIVLGVVLALGGMALLFYSAVIVGLFGWTISGDLWALIGFGLGFFAARPEDAGAPLNSDLADDDVALGTIAPIAAELAAGRLTAEEAERQIRESAIIAPHAPALWRSMSAKEREEIGLNFMRLAADPEFASRIERQLEPLRKADPKLWEQSLAATGELGSSRDGNDS